GIMNSGYKKKTAFVLRAALAGSASSTEPDQPNGLGSARVNRFSSWCPKIIAQIGDLPPTLADRCIVLRLQRKTQGEQCERLRNLEPADLRRQCARFALDHQQAIADARP